MKRYRLTPRAEENFQEIEEYLTETVGAVASDQRGDQLIATFHTLAEQPALGSPRIAWIEDDSILFWPVHGTPAVVIYRVTTPLQVVRIWNGRRNPARLIDAVQEGIDSDDALERLETKLLRAMNDGNFAPDSPELWESLRAEAFKRARISAASMEAVGSNFLRCGSESFEITDFIWILNPEKGT